jgi:hypothetical protein
MNQQVNFVYLSADFLFLKRTGFSFLFFCFYFENWQSGGLFASVSRR